MHVKEKIINALVRRVKKLQMMKREVLIDQRKSEGKQISDDMKELHLNEDLATHN